MSKQTAVEWFWNEIAEVLPFTVDSITAIKMYDKLQQAKAIEKEQIVEAWNGGNYGYFYSKGNKEDFNDGSEYYNEVYKGGEQ